MSLTDFPPTLTNDKIEAEISDMAEKSGDEWRMRIARRDSNGGLTVIGTFSEARAQHFTYPEAWLGRLAGGGEYRLQAFHASSPNKAFSGPKTVRFQGAPKDPDFSLMNLPDWEGPQSLITKFEPKKEEVPRMPTEGGGLASQPLARSVQPPSVGASPEDKADYWIAREKALAEREASMRLEAERRERGAEIARLEAKIAEAQKPVQMPDFGAMFREFTAVTMAMSEKSEARMERLLTTLTAKKEDSPLLQILMDKALSGADTTQKWAAQVQENMMGMMRGNVQFVQTMTEMMKKDVAPTEEDGILPLVREVVRGFAEASAAKREEDAARAEAQRAARARAVAQQRQLVAAQAPKAAPVAPVPASSPLAGVPEAVEPESEEESEEVSSVLAVLDEMIRSYEEPEKVIETLIANLSDTEVQEDLRKHGAKLTEWFAARHGAWALGEGQKAADYAAQLAAIAKEKFSALQSS